MYTVPFLLRHRYSYCLRLPRVTDETGMVASCLLIQSLGLWIYRSRIVKHFLQYQVIESQILDIGP